MLIQSSMRDWMRPFLRSDVQNSLYDLYRKIITNERIFSQSLSSLFAVLHLKIPIRISPTALHKKIRQIDIHAWYFVHNITEQLSCFTRYMISGYDIGGRFSMGRHNFNTWMIEIKGNSHNQSQSKLWTSFDFNHLDHAMWRASKKEPIVSYSALKSNVESYT